jgi:class 3 adenylate cyclase
MFEKQLPINKHNCAEAGEMAKDIVKWLEELGLGRFGDVFAENDVDLDILPRLSDDDLKELGLPLGARRRLQLALDTLTGDHEATAEIEIGSTLAPAAADQAERRQLTLMFCDLVRSTALST